MKIIEKYTGEKVYMFPNGSIADKEAVLKSSPAALTFVHIVETDESGEVMFALQNLSAMKSIYNIPKDMPEDEAIQAIQDIVNAPAPEPELSVEERIASALEFQSMMMLPVEE